MHRLSYWKRLSATCWSLAVLHLITILHNLIPVKPGEEPCFGVLPFNGRLMSSIMSILQPVHGLVLRLQPITTLFLTCLHPDWSNHNELQLNPVHVAVQLTVKFILLDTSSCKILSILLVIFFLLVVISHSNNVNILRPIIYTLMCYIIRTWLFHMTPLFYITST